MTTYRRPAAPYRSELWVSKSHFITAVERATTVEAARQFISTIRQEFPDASHHVYAFCIGYGNSVTEGMSDDGEPSGTSGPPTLAILRGADLGDVVLVTTRYFGGIKLGTGGLVRAYSEAARTALASIQTELKAPKVQFGIDMPYTLYEPVRKLVEQYCGTIDDVIFSGDVSLIATLLAQDMDAFQAELTDLSSGQLGIIVLATLD